VEGTLPEEATELDVTEVRAAGGLVTRRDGDGSLQVLIVHRARYDDWSFPKGKLDEGESFEQAALREVEEETGLVCRIEMELPTIRYRDAQDRPKMVRYWHMTVVDGDISDFQFNAEISDLRWVKINQAAGLLSYRHDRELLNSLS
jgi:8-oxo-dGTP diphosphatase